MEGRIKSAYEIAMEKSANLGPITDEQQGELKWVPEGQKLAARLLREELDIQEALKDFHAKTLPYVRKGMVGTLLANLSLPRTEADKGRHGRVLAALAKISPDKRATEELTGRVNYVFEQYFTFGRQQIAKSYNELKQQFTDHLQMELKRQGQAVGAIDVEAVPEFQAQARAMRMQFDGQYEQHLEDVKEQIKALSLGRSKR